MELSQIYANATNAFQNDPELRNLLMATMDQATQQGAPPVGTAAGPQPRPGFGAALGVMPQANPSPGGQQFTPQQVEALRNQTNQSNKMDKLVPDGTNAPMPGGGAPMSGGAMPAGPATMPAGPIGAQQPFDGSAARAPGAPPPAPPSIVPQVAAQGPQRGPAPQVAGPSTGQSIAAFLQGLGSSNALLPAIGGGMAAVEGLERNSAAQNQTMRALMGRGLDAETARAAIGNPEILKAVLPGLFGGTEKQLGSIYNEKGEEQKGFYDKHGNFAPIGGTKGAEKMSPLSVTQGKANIKRVEVMKNNAQDASGILGDIAQLRGIRETVGYEGWGKGSDLIAAAGDVLGVSQGRAINSTALNLTLGFTNKTKGAVTDVEMGLFKAAVPGLNMGDEAAESVLNGMEAGAQRTKERARFFEKYLSAHKGSLEGAEESWDAYINANPIITQGPDGKLQINKANIGNWRSYVGDDNNDPGGTNEPSGGDVNVAPKGGNAPLPGAGANSGFVDNPFSKKGGGSGPSADAPAAPMTNRPVVRTQEEYDAVPKDGLYLDFDEATGKTIQRRKR